MIDDDPEVRRTLSRQLAEDGYATIAAAHAGDALAALEEEGAEIVLCGTNTPAAGDPWFGESYTARCGAPLVIAMSAAGDADAAAAAIRRGAYDHISRPFRIDELRLRVRRAAEHVELLARLRRLETELRSLRGMEIVGQSAGFRSVVEMARKLGRHQSTVLVTGERGTGKETIARLIHQSSPRADQPFVTLDCGALPDALLESRLFGHVKGSFAGAASDSAGVFEDAERGTLLLDEIGELPGSVQVKLLRVLQEGEVRRAGSNGARAVDVRVIAATSRDLAADATSGRFREDLYYRVNVVGMRLPPLRERRDDIPALALHFVRKHGARFEIDDAAIEPDALGLLMEYEWPGNVRELENVVERALVLSGGCIRGAQVAELVHHRAIEVSSADGDLSVKRRTEDLERRLIRRALERTRGNRTRAARLLDLSHRALLYKIRDYGLGD